MLSIWTHHIKDPEHKVQYERELNHSVTEFNRRLRAILRDMDTSLSNQENSVKAYESSNWAYRQADTNGYRRCIKKLLTITDLDQKDQEDERPSSTPGTVSVPI